ncbi:MAG: 3'-5' exonuclease [Candidatus Gracilibacteria bacterium]|nr:3'-5' exonuclease [Candidatus Gracilibacteria bacterium]
MAIFKFNYISYDKILESAKGKDMIDAIEQPSDENLLVNGLPGCGKSTIAVHRLDKFKNKKGGLLTYGKLLTAYIKLSLENDLSKSKVFGFWNWFFLYRKKYGFEKKDIKDISGEDFRITFQRMLTEQGKYDFLFVDEGQDLPKDLYMHLGLIANHISVFADDAQQLYGDKNAKVENIINGIDPIQYELNVNRRNPRGLYEFALAFNPNHVEKGNLKLMTNKSDPVEVYKCINFVKEYDKILSLIEEFDGKNIAVLFTKIEAVNKFSYLLNEDNVLHSVYHNEISDNELYNLNSPIVTTFHSVKGLEFDIVIIPGLYPDIRNLHITGTHYYVAATRASEKLIITHHNSNSEIEEKINNIDKKLFEEYDLTEENDDINTNDIPF